MGKREVRFCLLRGRPSSSYRGRKYRVKAPEPLPPSAPALYWSLARSFPAELPQLWDFAPFWCVAPLIQIVQNESNSFQTDARSSRGREKSLRFLIVCQFAVAGRALGFHQRVAERRGVGGAWESMNRTTVLHSDKGGTQHQCARRNTSEMRGWRCGFMRRTGWDEAGIGKGVARRRSARQLAWFRRKGKLPRRVNGQCGPGGGACCWLIGLLEQSETERKEFRSLPVSEEAEVADGHRAARQQVKQEAAQELFDGQVHEPLLVAVRSRANRR